MDIYRSMLSGMLLETLGFKALINTRRRSEVPSGPDFVRLARVKPCVSGKPSAKKIFSDRPCQESSMYFAVPGVAKNEPGVGDPAPGMVSPDQEIGEGTAIKVMRLVSR
jgi:hypothetical protein